MKYVGTQLYLICGRLFFVRGFLICFCCILLCSKSITTAFRPFSLSSLIPILHFLLLLHSRSISELLLTKNKNRKRWVSSSCAFFFSLFFLPIYSKKQPISHLASHSLIVGHASSLYCNRTPRCCGSSGRRRSTGQFQQALSILPIVLPDRIVPRRQ